MKLVPEQAVAPEVLAKRQSFESRTAREPGNIALLLEYGEYLASVGLHDAALEQLHNALELDPTCEDAHERAVAVYRSRKEWDNMAAQLLLLLERRPGDVDLRRRLVEAYVSGGRKREAVKVLAEISAQVPEDIELLIRRRDLLSELADNEELVDVCKAILRLDPQDLPSWERLSNALLAMDREPQAVEAFRHLLRLDPKHPRANLYVGKAYHNAALQGPSHDWTQAITLLQRAVARDPGDALISATETQLATLYWCSAQMRSAPEGKGWLGDLKRIGADCLDGKATVLLAQCLAMAGNQARKADRLDEALEACALALKHQDSASTREALARIHEACGDTLLLRRKLGPAEEEYRRGLDYLGKDPGLTAKAHEARRKRRQRLTRRAACGAVLAAVLCLAGAFLYYSQQMFEIRVEPAAMIQFSRGKQVLFQTDGSELRTGLLRFGPWTVHIEKPGYETVETRLWALFGRGIRRHKVALAPVYGTLRVNTDPPAAHVTVRNEYEKRTGVTPCEIAELFALPSTIEIRHPKKAPVFIQEAIPANGVLDLGTIALEVDLTTTAAAPPPSSPASSSPANGFGLTPSHICATSSPGSAPTNRPTSTNFSPTNGTRPSQPLPPEPPPEPRPNAPIPLPLSSADMNMDSPDVHDVTPGMEREVKDISGHWDLRRRGNPKGPPTSSLKLELRDSNLSASGKDWSGKGTFDGHFGLYTWEFADGRKGTTKFTLTDAGELLGEVRGGGIDWDFVATRR